MPILLKLRKGVQRNLQFQPLEEYSLERLLAMSERRDGNQSPYCRSFTC